MGDPQANDLRRELNLTAPPIWRTTRATVVIALLLIFVLAVMPQTKDMLAGIQENLGGRFVYHLCLAFFAFSTWYWSRAVLQAYFKIPDNPIGRQAIPETKAGWLFCWLPRITLGAVLFAGLIAAWRSDAWWDFLITLVWGIALIALLTHRIAIQRHFGLLAPGKDPPQSPDGGSWYTRIIPWMRYSAIALCRYAPFGPWFAGTALAFAFALFVLSAFTAFAPSWSWSSWPVALLSTLPGPAAVCVCAALMLGPLTYLTFASDRFKLAIPLGGGVKFHWRIPVLFLLALLVMLTPQWVRLHAVRVITEAEDVPTAGERQTLQDAYDRWRAVCGGEGARPIVVAISGGATRAGYWGLRVLADIDAMAASGKGSIFAISTVSGGSLGAAAYLSMRATEAENSCWLDTYADPRLMQKRDDNLSKGVRSDALASVASAYLWGDAARGLFGLPASLVRWVTGQDDVLRGGDRADALERAFERNWQAVIDTWKKDGLGKRPLGFERPFLQLFYKTGAAKDTFEFRGNVPVWVANGTDAQDGDRILTVPFRLDDPNPFRAARDALGILRADVPISTAIHNTARFPYLSPSGELAPPGADFWKSYPQVIDGGYFENNGLQTALELVRWLKKAGADPILIGVSADSTVGIAESHIPRCSAKALDPARPDSGSRPLQLLAPLQGVYSARGGHSAVALADAVKLLCPVDPATEPAPGAAQAMPDPIEDPPKTQAFFHFYLYAFCQEEVPLNWVLSEAMAKRVWTKELCMGGNRTERQNLAAQLGSSVPENCVE
jgi:hypothetical protein